MIALGVLLSRPLVQPSNPAVEGEIRSDACVCDMRTPASTWTRRRVDRSPVYCYMVRVQKLSVDLGVAHRFSFDLASFCHFPRRGRCNGATSPIVHLFIYFCRHIYPIACHESVGESSQFFFRPSLSCPASTSILRSYSTASVRLPCVGTCCLRTGCESSSWVLSVTCYRMTFS